MVHHGWGVIAMPARVSSSARTAAAISSLPTSTPLQSKMITGLASARVLRGRADLKCPFDESALEKQESRPWQQSAARDRSEVFCTTLGSPTTGVATRGTNVARKPLI